MVVPICIALFTILRVSVADVRFMALGDWGTGDDMQRTLAQTMANYAANVTVDFIISTGDNIYPWGVSSVDDEQLNTKWRYIYNHTTLANLPWYLCVGNHDHGEFDDGYEWNEVQFSQKEPRWIMPDLNFTFTKAVSNNVNVQFFAIDSESIWVQKNNFTRIVQFLESQLAASTAKWKVVFAHHPAYSSGRYAGMPDIRELVVTPMERNNVDMYLVGHDHNMQHLRKRTGSNLDHVISGAGGRRLYAYDELNHQEVNDLGVELLNFQEQWGFVSVNVAENAMTVTYIDIDGNEIYTFTRNKS